MSDNDQIWNREQVPFETSAERAETSAATASAAAGAASAANAAPQTDAPSATGPLPGAWAPTGAGYVPPQAAGIPAASQPSPAAAFWLGLIPGVGAMYNGQVAKGFLHLIVFMVLVTIANRVDVFGFAVAGWIFFMAFEAYHTAKAQREGRPLPDPFGWNDVGERIGLSKGWPFQPSTGSKVTTATSGVPDAPYAAASAAGTSAATSWAPVSSPSAAPITPNWAGYVAPSAFAAAPAAVAAYSSPGGVPPGQGIDYSPVNTGASYAPSFPADLSIRGSRLPVGAMWLIGLGVLFLFGQWIPVLQFSRVWFPSLVLAGIAALLFARRMGWTGQPLAPAVAALPPVLRAATAVRIPCAILTVAILNGLSEAWIVRWSHSWPWLLIVFGGLMLVERMALRQAAQVSAPGESAAERGGLNL